MPPMPAAARPEPPTSSLEPALTAVEAQERLDLREAVRERQSVGAFARGWYSGLASLMATGAAIKLLRDAKPGFPVALVAVCALAVFGWAYCLRSLWRSRRLARVENRHLARLQILDARAPKAPELF